MAEGLAETSVARAPVGRPARPTLGRLAVAGIITLALLPFNAQFLIHSETVYYAGFPTTISLFYHAVFVIFLVRMLNVPLKRWLPALVLGPAEMAVIYIGLCIASTVAAHDAVQVLVSSMGYAARFATPENNWKEVLLPYEPPWLVVSDPASLKVIHEGGGSIYDPVVYRPWLEPGAWWLVFTMAFHMGTFGLVSVFRRRWVESERLTFPIIQLPDEIMTGRGGFLRQPTLWIALGVALAIDTLNGLHVLYPNVPQIPTRGEAAPAFNLGALVTDRPWDAMGSTFISFYPIIIGLGLLLPTELAFSCWFYLWFWRGAKILTRALGMEVVPLFPYIDYQSLGGYIGIAFFAFWLSRKYLWTVLRSTLSSRSGLDQSREAMPYGWAVPLFVGCFAFLIWFSVNAGMSLGYAVAFFVIYFSIAFSISRIRAEMGMPAHDLHFAGPCDILPAIIGTRNLTPQTRAVSRFYFWFNRAYRNHHGPHQIEALKLCETTGLQPKAASATIVLGTFLGCFAAYWAILWCLANYGASTGKIAGGGGQWFGQELHAHMNTELVAPEPARSGPFIALLFGMAFMVANLALKMRVPWFPIHPAGFAVSASWTMQFMWCPLLIAWTIKTLVSRYGGGTAYRRLVPIAFGLILGDLMGGVLWSAYGIKLHKQIYSVFQ